MTGAGISTAAGIPDFRSPGSGLYYNLQKYDLPYPQAVFEISYFKVWATLCLVPTRRHDEALTRQPHHTQPLAEESRPLCNFSQGTLSGQLQGMRAHGTALHPDAGLLILLTFPSLVQPTVSHYFSRLLASKGLLQRHFTQNIDTLERVAGVPSDKLVEAHGSFNSAHCIGCRRRYSPAYIKGASLLPRQKA